MREMGIKGKELEIPEKPKKRRDRAYCFTAGLDYL